MQITRAQLRGARGMLGWTVCELSKRSGLSRHAIRKIERNLTNPQPSTSKAFMDALKDAGVEFIENGIVLREPNC